MARTRFAAAGARLPEPSFAVAPVQLATDLSSQRRQFDAQDLCVR